ncbi:MAG TPA: TonB family protein, partial [Myxococcales bacterium]|nr:TonB family protein [Myxococcales bacterium]
MHGLAATLLLALAQSGENVREAPPPAPVRPPELTRAPTLIDFHPADYPPDRLARGEEADVGCLVDIDADGRVTGVLVDRPAAPDFDEAAVAAIRAFRFSPAEIDGKPSAVRVHYVYHFVVRKEAAPAPDDAADLATLRGTVVEAGTRRPIAGADVFAGGAQAAADAQGRFELRLPAGDVEVRAGAPGFAESRRRVQLEARGSAEVTVYLRRTEGGDYSAV